MKEQKAYHNRANNTEAIINPNDLSKQSNENSLHTNALMMTSESPLERGMLPKGFGDGDGDSSGDNFGF